MRLGALVAGKPLACTLAACTATAVIAAGWIVAQGPQGFKDFVSSADTPSYTEVALHLVETGRLVPTARTLGYPLFLGFAYAVAGERHALYLVIAIQLLLNLALAWLFWRLLERLAPDADLTSRVLFTVFYHWAGMGMALLVLSDLLASFFVAVFLYGFLFLRSRSSLVVAGVALAAATMVRPTFTFLPLLLPLMARLVNEATVRIGWPRVAFLALMSMVATAGSIAQQYSVDGYRGPSPILTQNIVRVLYYSSEGERPEMAGFQKGFEDEIGRRAGRPYGTLARAEQEAHAKRMLRERLATRPWRLVALLASTPFKYVLAPVESTIARVVTRIFDLHAYVRWWRPALTFLCLPIWLLCLIPPGSSGGRRACYWLMMLLLIYNVGITAINPLQGERIRFPVLLLMLPVAVWNIRSVRDSLVSRVRLAVR